MGRILHALLAVQEAVFETYPTEDVDGPIRGGFRFTGTAPASAEHGAAWRSLTAHVGSTMRVGLGDDPSIGSTPTQAVTAFCVACFPNNSPALGPSGPPPRRGGGTPFD